MCIFGCVFFGGIMKAILKIFILLTIGISFSAFSQTFMYNNGKLTLKNKLPWQEVVDQLLEKAPDIFILGEGLSLNHQSFQKFYISFAEYVSQNSSEYNCFFVYLDSKYSKFFDEFFTGTSSYKETIRKNFFTGGGQAAVLMGLEGLAETLKSLGIKIYLVGHTPTPEEIKQVRSILSNSDDPNYNAKYAEFTFPLLNPVLVQSLSQMKKTCSKTMGYVSYGHLLTDEYLYDGYNGKPFSPIQADLQHLGFKTATIHLYEGKEEASYNGFGGLHEPPRDQRDAYLFTAPVNLAE